MYVFFWSFFFPLINKILLALRDHTFFVLDKMLYHVGSLSKTFYGGVTLRAGLAKWWLEAIDTTDGETRVRVADGQEHRYAGDAMELAIL